MLVAKMGEPERPTSDRYHPLPGASVTISG